MRCFVPLTLWFFLLVVATGALWNHRFQRSPDLPVWTLEDLRRQAPEVPEIIWTRGTGDLRMRIQKGDSGEDQAFRIAFSNSETVSALHFSFAIRSENLVPGREKWQDGRIFLEWHRGGNERTEDDYVASIRHSCEVREAGYILKAPKGLIVPALRFEHLGREGFYELGNLEITPVHERSWWGPAAWGLSLLWAFSIWLTFCRMKGRGILNSGGVAVLWTSLALLWMVPGPWKSYRPLHLPWSGDGFDLSTDHCESHRHGESRITDGRVQSGRVKPSGEMPVQGSVFLKAKHLVAAARPLLHALMLAVPAFLFGCMLGRHRSVLLSVLLALGIEASQIAFGYGFGWDDVMDLLTDALGIALGLWMAGRPVFRSLLRRSVNRCFGD